MYRFAFNLLPKKSKEEIKKEQDRENTSLLIAFLPLLAIVVSIGLLFFNNLVIQRNVSTWEDNLENRNQQILGFSDTLSVHNEFIQRTELLAEPVELDVSPQLFFDMAEDLTRSVDFRVDINTYARNSDGSFDLTVQFQNQFNTADVVRAFENLPNVSSPNAKDYAINQATDTSNLTLNFFLIEENGGQTQQFTESNF